MATWLITGCSSGLGRAIAVVVLAHGHNAVVTARDVGFDTHFVGTVAMIKAVLPNMRERRSGTIVNLSSIGVLMTAAGSGCYAAAKAAVEGMTGALRKEVAPLGIRAMVIEPGAFRTDFAGRSLTQSATVIDDYAETAGKRRTENDTSHGTQGGDPRKAAEATVSVVASGDAPGLLVLGRDVETIYRAALEARLASLEQ